MSSGQRMHTRYFQVGGVIEDIPLGFATKVREFIARDARRAIDQYARPARQERDLPAAPARASAPSPRERLLELGVTGPLLRATGDPWDLRKADALLRLRRLRLQDPGRHRRRQLRPLPGAPAEIDESLQDHRAGARRPARGPVHHRRPQGRAAAAARAGDLDGGADPPLQARHRGLPRARRARSTSRSSRRAASSAASSSPTAPRKPARVHMRDPRFVNLQALARHGRAARYIADMIATLAMLDPILGGIDR